MGADQLRQTTTGECLLHKMGYPKYGWPKFYSDAILVRERAIAKICRPLLSNYSLYFLPFFSPESHTLSKILLHLRKCAPHGICLVIACTVEAEHDVPKALIRHPVRVYRKDQRVIYGLTLCHGPIEERVHSSFTV